MRWLDWLRRRRTAEIPAALWQTTLNTYPCLAMLTVDEQSRLKKLSEKFLASKEFSAAGGLILNDEICVAIAAQGCLLILELGLGAYDDWVGIIVYPDEFAVPRELADDAGIVHQFTDVLAGEAWEGGPLLISWRDMQLAEAGYNVVIHEFAHKLDMLNGAVDGMPALHSGLRENDWADTLFAAYDNFCQRVDQGEETPIDPYGSEAPEEFFAVISENFFTRPVLVAAEYPDLYELLASYYRQDTLRRVSRPRGTAGAVPIGPT